MSELTRQSYPVDLTADEVQVLTCAMAGNFPPRLAHLRMGVLRKLARAVPRERPSEGGRGGVERTPRDG